MINIYEYLLSKTKKDDGRIKATDETIDQLVKDSIKQYGTDVDLNFINTSAVTNMSALFDQEDFKGNVSDWDVSNVTNMEYMFYGCKHFNCDLSEWNVSKVKDMHNMFYWCESFDGKCLEDWDVSSVEDMRDMFVGCKKFNADLSKWELPKLKKAMSMFNSCINFKGKGLDKWKTPELTAIQDMFGNCKILDVDLSNWITDKIESWSYFSYGSPLWDQREKWPKFKF